MACRVPRGENRFWLYHRAQLELARERQAQRGGMRVLRGPAAPPADGYVSSIYRVTQSPLWSRMSALAASITVVVMALGQLWLHWR